VSGVSRVDELEISIREVSTVNTLTRKSSVGETKVSEVNHYYKQIENWNHHNALSQNTYTLFHQIIHTPIFPAVKVKSINNCLYMSHIPFLNMRDIINIKFCHRKFARYRRRYKISVQEASRITLHSEWFSENNCYSLHVA
jgi:hypothetical protein